MVNQEGEQLGTLVDIVLEAASGRVTQAVLSSEGGESPLPWGRFVWEAEGPELIADVTAQHLRGAPRFRAQEWDREQWPDEVEGYYEAVEEEETGVAGFDTAADATGRAESPTGQAAPKDEPPEPEVAKKPS